jgi:hypothetical protein
MTDPRPSVVPSSAFTADAMRTVSVSVFSLVVSPVIWTTMVLTVSPAAKVCDPVAAV